MKSFKLTGFGTVFSFNLKKNLKSKKFVITTVIFAVLIIGAIFTALLVSSRPDKESEDHEMKLGKVYVSDETGFGVPDYGSFAALAGFEDFKDVEFESAADAKKLSEEHSDDGDFVLVIQTENEEDDVYQLNIVTGDKVDETDVGLLEELVTEGFRNHLYENSGLTEEELIQVLIPVHSSAIEIGGEDEGMAKEIITVIAIFFTLMLIYFMILFYGQAICTEVSLEKTSKLVEQMLTSVTPYALVAGKVLSTILASIIQFAVWIAAIVFGCIAGDGLVKMVYDIKESRVGFYMDSLKEIFEGSGFSAGAVVLAVLLIIAGLVFYLSIAGFAGSLVTKPEEAPNMQAVFVLPMVASFMVLIFALVNGEGNISAVYSLIPFTGAMTAAGEVLVGNLSIGLAVLALLILVVCSLLILWVAAKIYRGLLFFSGNKINPKLIWDLIK